tara:strand:- start:468 stop:614 length:147 start_codon:yes stop_codon:yes gene_type:complete
MGITNVLYALLSIVLHLEVLKCPLILLPFLFPAEEMAIIDVHPGAHND